MSYVKIVNYSPKDALSTTDPAKLIKGAELGAEFDAIAAASTVSDNAIALRALIASPTFTGVPAAPTASAGTSTTQIATTAFVTAVDILKANIASPTFTGVPAAPTPATATNTTQIATTAMVQAVAMTAALPLQTGNSGKVVTTNGTDASWTDTLTSLTLVTPALGTPSSGALDACTSNTESAGNSTTQLATTAFATTADNLKANLSGADFLGQVNSTAGDPNLKTATTLGDDTVAITALQLIGGWMNITPTVARSKATDTAVAILAVAGFQNSINKSHFRTSLANLAAFDVTITAGVGVALEGAASNWIFGIGTAEIIVTKTSSTTVSMRRAAVVAAATFVKMRHTQTGEVATGTGTIPHNDTTPQITGGDQYMTRTFTPAHVDNRLLIKVTMVLSAGANQAMVAALFVGATANALASAFMAIAAGNYHVLTFTHEMAAGTTSELTFRARAGGNNSGTTTFNGVGGARLYGGVLASSITVTETTP